MTELPRTDSIDKIKVGQMIGVPHKGGTTVIEVRHIEQTPAGLRITSETGGKWDVTHNDKVRIVFG